MTPAQNKLYWREFAAAQRAAGQALGRHAMHAQALGADKSHLDFTNADLDKVLAVFRAISQPDNLGAQVRQMQQTQFRAGHKLDELLKCVAVYVTDAEAYVERVSVDKFHTRGWCHLTPTQTTHLIYTLSRCLNGKGGLRNRAGHSMHDMFMLAGLDCACAACEGAKAEGKRLKAEVERPF